MLRKKLELVKDTMNMTYIKATNGAKAAARGLKEDVSGMEIIQVVMIIAIGVLAVAAVWVVLGDLIGELWKQIGTSGKLDPLDLTTNP